jgi:hypothetical protein
VILHSWTYDISLYLRKKRIATVLRSDGYGKFYCLQGAHQTTPGRNCKCLGTTDK